MKTKPSRVLVTGGAGFIGSHLVDKLMAEGHDVRVVDNLSSGSLSNIEPWLNSNHFEFVKDDLKKASAARRAMENMELVFHLAANPEVRVGEVNPSVHFRENLLATFKVLEAMRETRTPNVLVFFSSSTVYGDAEEMPTPENYGPLLPISIYGASKLGCESLVSSFAHMFGIRGIVFRLANIIGSRSKHGVTVDFVHKLRKNPRELEILGDGSQNKSFLHINDLIDGVLLSLRNFLKSKKSVEVYNVGSLDRISVKRIAGIVCKEMGLKNVKYGFTGGVDGGRGWRGDVKLMLLSVEKLLNLGWKPKLGSEEAISLVCRELLKDTRARNKGV